MQKVNRTLIISSISVASAIIAIIASLFFINIIITNSSLQTTWVTITIILVIFTLALGAFQIFDKAKEVHSKRPEWKTSSLKITIDLDGEPITVETTDVKRAAEILKLVQDLQTKPSSHT
jgi:hypothetical protein